VKTGLEANLSTHVVLGRIVSPAREWQADLVVVGLPEATFIRRCTEGASFARVMADAPCPVIFARAPKTKAG